MNSAFPSFTQPVSHTRDNAALGRSASSGSLLNRLWHGLLEAGQRRAAGELAHHVRLHGGRPTGTLAQDAQQLAALRGLL